MAAIKRSQATQRRHPEMYHLQQIHGSAGNQTTSVVKVELKYFILSILDDPIVSRVFAEAGFRSCDIKLDVLHPPTMQFSSRFPRTRPPLFLCNLTDSDPARVGFRFPFYENDDFDENCRRIGEVLGRKEKKNPLLVGNCANDALKSFIETVKRGKLDFLPLEISGLGVTSIEKEISEFVVNVSRNEEEMESKLDELRQIAEHQCSESGLVLNLGELKGLIDSCDTSGNALRCLVPKLTNLLKTHEGKLWLIGSVSSTESYSRVLDRFPTIEQDWDLHLLPITSSKPSRQDVYAKSSLMRSFVPFGGFFSSPSDFRTPFSSSNQSVSCCHLCNEKYEQEVAVVMKAGSNVSVADQCSDKRVDDIKAKDDGIGLNSRITELQKKWSDICRRIHQTPAFPKLNIYPTRSDLPIQSAPDKKESSTRLPLDRSLSLSPPIHVDVPETSSRNQKIQIPSPSAPENINFKPGLSVTVSKSRQREDLSGFAASKPLASSSPVACCTPSSSITSVATDLGLGTIYGSTSQDENTPKSLDQRGFGEIIENNPHQTPRSSCPYGPLSEEQFNAKDFKSLKEFLYQKVSWQPEAVNTVSEVISRSRANRSARKSPRGVWLSFLGPDRIAKKKIASALADTIYGSRQNLVSVDFSAQESYDDTFRGKTAVDYVVGELLRKPQSVVFLENVDKAEYPDQISLLDAVRRGKLRDSHGREIGTNSMVFVATSSVVKDDENILKSVLFPEKRILEAKSWKMQIKVSKVSEDTRTILEDESSILLPRNKRKQEIITETEERNRKAQRSYLDLNLPVEDTEENNTDSDSVSENTEAWLEDFLEQVDGKVVFKPFDFDGLAQKIERDILFHFHRSFGSEKAKLCIDKEVIIQILAACWSSEKERPIINDWLQNVLSLSFAEARQKYGLTNESVVRLVACKGCPMEEQSSRICLPAKIDML